MLRSKCRVEVVSFHKACVGFNFKGESYICCTEECAESLHEKLKSKASAGFDLPQMYSLILMIGLLGYVLNRIAEFWTKKLGNYGKHL